MEGIVLADELLDLHGRAKGLQQYAQDLQTKQARLNRQYDDVMAQLARIWQDFEQTHSNRPDFAQIYDKLRKSHLAEHSLEFFEQGEHETLLDQALRKYFNLGQDAPRENYRMIIQLLAEHGGKITEEHGGNLLKNGPQQYVGEEVLKILVEQAEVCTPLQQDARHYFSDYTDKSVQQLSSSFWCFFHSLNRKRRHLFMEQEVVSFFYLPRSVDLIIQDQKLMEMLLDAYKRNRASFLDNGQWRDILHLLPQQTVKLLMPSAERLMLMQGAELEEVTTLTGQRVLAVDGPS